MTSGSVGLRNLFLAALTAQGLLTEGEASGAESTNWLINNPVSMMDWGSQKAKKSAQSAADMLNGLMESRAKQDFDFEFDKSIPEEVKKKTLEDRKRWTDSSYPQKFGYRYGPGFAGYDLKRDRIVVGVFVKPSFPYPGKIDTESCTEIVNDFRNMLLGAAESPKQLAAEIWFTHNGYKPSGMPANFEKDLTDHIIVAVHLDRFATVNSAITCEQPLAGGSITSVTKMRPE